ncbi:MAG: YfcE family phosphodiesterase [Clostridia bacterium]|nr:YfcE family phosphodiesterase [Clostridia bacterium]
MKSIKCLVASDSHGAGERLLTALRRAREIDALLFLGDGLSDLCAVTEKYPQLPIIAVKGNCDFGNPLPGRSVYKIDSITLGEKKIVLTHGDLYGAKYGLDGLIRLAAATNADIVLYGHTHLRAEQYTDGVYYFNPGSLRGDRDLPSAGILTVTDGGVLFSFMSL